MKSIFKTLIVLLIITATLYFYDPSLIYYFQDHIPEDIQEVVEKKMDDILDMKGENILSANDKDEFEFLVNQDANSEIPLMIQATNGETIAAVKGDNDRVKKVLIKNVDDQVFTAELNSDEQLSRVVYGNQEVIYSNYQENSVDIEWRSGGNIKKFPAEKLNSRFLDNQVSIFSVHAESQQYYPRKLGQIMDTLSCAGGGVFTFMSGGTASPLLYFTCGRLTARGVSGAFSLGPCKGDIVECFMEGVQDLTPAGWKTWPTIAGRLIDRNSNLPIKVAVMELLDKNQQYAGRSDVKSDGSFEMQIKKKGDYSIVASAEGYQDSSLPIFFTEQYLSIPTLNIKESASFFNNNVLKSDIAMQPDAMVKFEVIDSESGLGIEDAKIEILELGINDTVYDDGTYVFTPKLSSGDDMSLSLQISAQDYETRNFSLTLTSEIENGLYKLKKNNKAFNGIFKLTKSAEEEILEEDSSEKKIYGSGTGPMLSGKVLDVNGAAIEGVEISYYGALDSGVNDSGLMSSSSNGSYGPVILHRGNYTLMFKDKSNAHHVYKLSLNIKDKEIEKYDHDTGKRSLIFTMNTDSKNPPFEYDVHMQAVLPYDGRWTGQALDKTGNPDCAGGNIDMTVKSGKLSGAAYADAGYSLSLQGNVDIEGTISAGSADGNFDDAGFTGQLSTNTGSGMWASKMGCGGTFTLKKEQY